MNVWVTNASTSRYAGINTLWAAIMWEDFIPERLHILANEYIKQKGYLDTALKDYKSILDEYGSTQEPIVHDFDETDFPGLAKLFESIVRKEKEQGNIVAIDMTPGRKIISAMAMFMGVGDKLQFQADKIFYLYMKDLGPYEGHFFPMIPSNLMRLYDVKHEVMRGTQ